MPKGSCLQRTAIVIAVLCALAGGGIALWKLLPEESKASIQGVINQTRDNLGDVGLPNNPLPTGDDGQPPNNGYVFMQCTDNPAEAASLTNTNSSSSSTTNCCNGLDSICDLRVDEILFAGVHNAMATRKDGFLLAPNHLRTLEESLEAGYRAINIDMANCDDGFQLVHGRCSLGTRSPTQVFANLVDFLESNPSEVILLNMQIDDDAGVAPVLLNDIYNLMYAVPGFTNMMYSHDSTTNNEWPTLRELIDSNQRILFFFYDGTENCREDTCPTGFHDWFASAAETEFSFSSEELVRDTATSCVVTRGDVTRAAFFGVNVFVTLPNQAASQSLNTFESLQEHMEACSSLNSGADVNVIFVDFWENGDLPKLVQTENSKRA